MKQCLLDVSVIREGGKYFSLIAILLCSVSITVQTHVFNTVLRAMVQLRVAGSKIVSK